MSGKGLAGQFWLLESPLNSTLVPQVESGAQGLQAFLAKQHVTETLWGKKKDLKS